MIQDLSNTARVEALQEAPVRSLLPPLALPLVCGLRVKVDYIQEPFIVRKDNEDVFLRIKIDQLHSTLACRCSIFVEEA